MESENIKLLVEGAKQFGIDLDKKTLDAFDLFLKELLKWNQKINLTGIRTEKGIIVKHFLDSLSVCPHLPKSASILDIGSGAGFPGIPVKIVDPAFEVTLLDSVGKKVDFQKHVIRRLGLRRIEAVHGRVEDGKIRQTFDSRFDCVLSRAFSNLQTFLLLSAPFLKEGGIALAMKGDLKEVEIQAVKGGEVARYQLRETVPFTLPFTSFKRTILLFQKQ
jgi:16S rRNA (guanine527-N7)-methyltransferase